MKKIILLVVFVSGLLSAIGQVTGFMGKRFIAKTNLVNGRSLPFNCLDLEYVLVRRTSLNVSYQMFNYSRGESGVSAKTGTLKPGNNRDEVKEISTLKSGTTKGQIISAGLRYYFNGIIPAPFGYYTELNIGFGSATYRNYQVTYSYRGATSYSDLSNSEVHFRPASLVLSGKSSIIFFELPSFGYQRIFKRLIVVDAKIAIQGQYCHLPDNLANAMEYNYYVRSNVIGFSKSNLNLGLAAYLKIGVLLF